MWTFENAIRVIRALQPATREFNYHLALGGGVLNKSYSNKDLDLYFLPMGGFGSKSKEDPDGMLAFLERLWGKSTPLTKEYYGNGISHYKRAVKFARYGGEDKKTVQRIDCFIF